MSVEARRLTNACVTINKLPNKKRSILPELIVYKMMRDHASDPLAKAFMTSGEIDEIDMKAMPDPIKKLIIAYEENLKS